MIKNIPVTNINGEEILVGMYVLFSDNGMRVGKVMGYSPKLVSVHTVEMPNGRYNSEWLVGSGHLVPFEPNNNEALKPYVVILDDALSKKKSSNAGPKRKSYRLPFLAVIYNTSTGDITFELQGVPYRSRMTHERYIKFGQPKTGISLMERVERSHWLEQVKSYYKHDERTYNMHNPQDKRDFLTKYGISEKFIDRL